jgi:SPP1 family phage portal protein
MEITELQSLLGTFEDLQKKVIAAKPQGTKFEEIQKEYNPNEHGVADKTLRPDKISTNGETTTVIPVARLPIPLQKRIVSRAAQFLCGNPIELSANPADQLQKDLLSLIIKTWDDNKLDFESKKLAKIMMSETEVAELWYTEDADETFWANTPNAGRGKFKLRMKVLANSLGDSLYPVYNNAGDMIAFGRGYSLLVEGKNEEHFDLYTADQLVLGTKSQAGWTTESIKNITRKIPVIYYKQDAPEWSDVQALIDRLERTISNHADTNDYFGSPMVVTKGKILGFAKKGESGKVLELEGSESSAEYLTWDQSPESVKLEMTNLRSLIYDMTDTPDFSFDQLKGMGTFSGIALKMLFLGAHMKAADKEETFGKAIQRRINYIKAALAVINAKMEPATALTVKPKFEYFLPKNDLERIEMLSTATGAKPILSRETAVGLNPFVTDVEAEIKRLDEEANSAGALDQQMN